MGLSAAEQLAHVLGTRKDIAVAHPALHRRRVYTGRRYTGNEQLRKLWSLHGAFRWGPQ